MFPQVLVKATVRVQTRFVETIANLDGLSSHQSQEILQPLCTLSSSVKACAFENELHRSPIDRRLKMRIRILTCSGV